MLSTLQHIVFTITRSNARIYRSKGPLFFEIHKLVTCEKDLTHARRVFTVSKAAADSKQAAFKYKNIVFPFQYFTFKYIFCSSLLSKSEQKSYLFSFVLPNNIRPHK